MIVNRFLTIKNTIPSSSAKKINEITSVKKVEDINNNNGIGTIAAYNSFLADKPKKYLLSFKQIKGKYAEYKGSYSELYENLKRLFNQMALQSKHNINSYLNSSTALSFGGREKTNAAQKDYEGIAKAIEYTTARLNELGIKVTTKDIIHLAQKFNYCQNSIADLANICANHKTRSFY